MKHKQCTTILLICGIYKGQGATLESNQNESKHTSRSSNFFLRPIWFTSLGHYDNLVLYLDRHEEKATQSRQENH